MDSPAPIKDQDLTTGVHGLDGVNLLGQYAEIRLRLLGAHTLLEPSEQVQPGVATIIDDGLITHSLPRAQ